MRNGNQEELAKGYRFLELKTRYRLVPAIAALQEAAKGAKLAESEAVA